MMTTFIFNSILYVSCLDPGDHDEDGGGGIRSSPAILGPNQSLHLTYEEQMFPRKTKYCALQK